MNQFCTANNDIMFKAIFCDEANKDLLNALIENMIGEKVNVIEIKNGELPVNQITAKKKMLDLLCIVDDKYVHIELNLNPHNYVRFRNFLYFTEVINGSINKGEDYNKTQKYIHIDLTYSSEFNDNDDDVYIYKVQNLSGRTYIDNVVIYEYNMNKVTKYFEQHDLNKIKKYKYLIMLGLNDSQLDCFPTKDKTINKFEDLLKIKNGDKELMTLFSAEKEIRIEKNTERRIAREEGHEEGLKEGRLEGLKKGMQETQMLIAKEMLNKNFDVDTIASCTKLTIDEIKNIK